MALPLPPSLSLSLSLHISLSLSVCICLSNQEMVTFLFQRKYKSHIRPPHPTKLFGSEYFDFDQSNLKIYLIMAIIRTGAKLALLKSESSPVPPPPPPPLPNISGGLFYICSTCKLIISRG